MTTPTDDTSDQTAARRARQKRRRDRSRAEILSAARTVLLRDGLAAMTLDAVAREAGMSKTGLYYYFASKEALVFELVFGVWESHGARVHDAVERTADGPAALGEIIRTTVDDYAAQMDDFRLAFLLAQMTGSQGLQLSDDQFARIRPINDLVLSGATRKLGEGDRRPLVEPRLLAFLAYSSALGVLTMKGLVESQGDPLLYSDTDLVEALNTVFATAAQARSG
jgi:AcrR family transcriptional regulator